MRKKPLDIGLGNNFFNMIPKAQATKAKIGLYQNKKLLHSKENHQENEEAVYGMGKNICRLYISHKDLISKICKKYIQFKSKNTNNLI